MLRRSNPADTHRRDADVGRYLRLRLDNFSGQMHIDMICRPLRVALLAALLVGTSPAEAKYRIGIGEQDPVMFSSPAWQSLRLKRVRYIVPWDWARTGQQ